MQEVIPILFYFCGGIPQDALHGGFHGVVLGLIGKGFAVDKAALFDHTGRAGVALEMPCNQKIQLFHLKQVADDFLYRFRHQAPAPAGFGQDIADLPPPVSGQFGIVLLVVALHAQGAHYAALVFQGKRLVLADEKVQDLPGFLPVFVGQPAGHLAHPVLPGIGVEVVQVAQAPGAQGQPRGVQYHVPQIDRRVHTGPPLLDHLAGGLVDVAAAQGQDQVALMGVLPDPAGGGVQAVHHHGAGDFGGQLLAADGGVVGLTAAQDGGQDGDVRQLEHVGKIIQQHLGAAVCKRLMDGDQPLVAQLFGGGQGGPHLGGVVGVVVHHHGAVALAADLEPAADALELRQGGGALLRGQAHGAADAAHRQGVVDVVVARHRQLDVARNAVAAGVPLLQVELIEAGAVLADVHRLVVAAVPDTEGAHPALDGVHHVHGVAVVGVGKDHELGHEGEPLEGKLQLAHAAVVVQMVVVDVQHHREIGGQLEEGLGKLAGFHHDVVAHARLAVAVDEGQLAADDRAGVAAGQLQGGGDHRSGGGLAVGARHADAALVQAADVAQQDAALDGGDAVAFGGGQLHIIFGDRGRIHHHIRPHDVVGVVAQGHPDAHGPLGLDDAAIQYVAAGDLVALGRQNLDQREHPAAPAADKMELGDMIQQTLVIIAEHTHIGFTSQISRPGRPPSVRPQGPAPARTQCFIVTVYYSIFGR